MYEAVIIGEVEAGRSHKVKTEIEQLLSAANKSTIDLAELLYETKKNYYYVQWGYGTFKEFIDAQEYKIGKAYYLIRIVEVMKQLQVPREKYEPVGIMKLREITSLDLNGTFNGKPMKDYMVAMVENYGDKSIEQVREVVRGLKGLTGDDALVWWNVCMKKSVRDQIVREAVELAKKNLGSAGRDADGNAVDASDGRALEIIAISYLQDINNQAEVNSATDVPTEQ